MIAIFTYALLSGQRPVIFGDGTQMRDYVFVKDVVQANLLALEPGQRGVFNIATGQGYALLTAYQQIAAQLQVALLSIFPPRNPYELTDNVLDMRRAQVGLGWQPQVSFEADLALQVRSIASQVGAPISHQVFRGAPSRL